ncbi:4'-phosphopantetheinyl transferase family protein [Paenibacillus whitsoniae]|uniref:4'-phosphopantetheinyl transferase family protein n=1 Tax=Paenibacillus whitsoniae TaxID=2496558 RepID=UPI0013DFDF1F|nr:4'-phosphopantetheinyl transferase superfamily protein [Paenibacillus whitsoniae]
MDALPASASDAGWQFLTEEKRAKLLRFRREEDRQRGLWAELLLRSIVCNQLGIANRSIAFVTNAYGKPQLATDVGLHFNVSHSGRWVVCLTDELPVGVDVEKHAPFDPKIAHSFFTEAEVRFLEEPAHPEERQHRFFQLWTAKESCIKAVGKGLSLPLHSFSVVPAISSDGLGFVDVEGGTWQLREPSLDLGYSFTVCCKPQAVWNGAEQVTAETILTQLKA